ncbi:ABC transporter permease [Paenibacillus chitinolyticus]|uniref:ABC transporter permease n=1 Tax=Paenibacillus chitinolyticus TaxID=79263 RepID=UPI003D07849C
MTIFLNCIRRVFQKGWSLLFIFVIPIILIVFLIMVKSQEVQYKIGIIDEDNTVFTQDFIEQLEGQYKIIHLTSKDDIKSKVINSELDGGLLFQQGFTKSLLDGEDVSVLIYDIAGTDIFGPVKVYVSSYISSAKKIASASGGDEKIFYQGMDYYKNSAFNVTYESSLKYAGSERDVSNAVKSLGFIASGMIFLMTFSTSLILQDKLSGVYDRIAVTPVSRFSYLLQNMLACFVIAAIQSVLLLSIIASIVDFPFGQTFEQKQEMLLVCLAFSLVCVALGIAISRFSNTRLMAGSLSTLIYFPMLMLGGCFWPREIMPKLAQQIGDFFPTTWFLQAGKDVIAGKGIAAASQQLIYLLCFAALLIFVSFIVRNEKVRT